MLSSMFTAITSLNLHQSYLDVIADNLANANTTGYKTNQVHFQTQFAQMFSPGSAPTVTGLGGVNPTQIGLGVKLGYIAPLFTQGALQSTGRNLDVAIQGDGFLIYNGTGGQQYSRDGSLEIDGSGYLVNGSTGMRVQGWSVAPGSSTAINPSNAIGDIAVPLDLTLAKATDSAVLTGNLDSSATNTTFDATVPGFDSLGNPLSVKVTFTKGASTATGTDWTWTVASPATTATTPETISFDLDGKAVPASSVYKNAITVPGTNGAAATVISLDMTGITQLAIPNSVTTATQNGMAAGQVSDVHISSNDGQVSLVYSNGLTQTIGQLALARFTNPAGLVRNGNSMYLAGVNSGTPEIGQGANGGRGTLAAGYLEGSNVDMAQEFTNMILAERGFQASSRVITTSDEVLQEIINLKR